MKWGRLFICATVALAPTAAFAIGGAVASAAGATGTVSQTTAVSITIPAVIAIDVESNVTFDFTSPTYHAPASLTDCTNAFPPGADCANVTYTPSTVTIPGSGTAGQIWLAIFSNKAAVTATMTVTAGAPTTFSADPGFTPQAIRLTKGTTNVSVNAATFGPASPTAIGTTAVPLDLKSGALTSSVFGWKRIDQTPDLFLPGSTTFNVVTGSTANITFTLKY